MNAAFAARVRQLQSEAEHRRAIREFRARRAADEQARIQDTVAMLDALLVPYNVIVAEVGDPADANVVIDVSTNSPVGSIRTAANSATSSRPSCSTRR